VNRDWGVQTGGQVTGGTPDRPLKRDAYMGIGYRNWMNLPIPQRPNDKTNDKKKLRTTADGTKLYYAYLGANAMVKGDLIGYPAKGAKARLVVGWQRISSGGAGSWGRTDEDFQKVFPKIVPKIRIEVAADANIENVRFDDLPRGGIVTPDSDIFKNWKNVTFGDACLSKDPKELIRQHNSRGKKPLEPEKKYISM